MVVTRASGHGQRILEIQSTSRRSGRGPWEHFRFRRRGRRCVRSTHRENQSQTPFFLPPNNREYGEGLEKRKETKHQLMSKKKSPMDSLVGEAVGFGRRAPNLTKTAGRHGLKNYRWQGWESGIKAELKHPEHQRGVILDYVQPPRQREPKEKEKLNFFRHLGRKTSKRGTNSKKGEGNRPHRDMVRCSIVRW